MTHPQYPSAVGAVDPSPYLALAETSVAAPDFDINTSLSL